MPIQWIEALSLRQKMMALNLFGITATLLVTLALFSLIYFVTARQRLTDSAEATARQLAQNTAAMLAFGDRVATRALLAALDAHSDAVMATVYDQRGAVFATWTHPRALPDDMSAAPAAVSADLGTGTVVRHLSTSQLDVLAPIFVQEERVGVLFLRESLRSINREIRQFALIGLGFTLGSITLAALLLNRLQLRALAPVFELSGLAERVAREYDYRLRARVRTGDEVGRLAECFNEMLERIEARERALSAEIGERRAAERRLDRLAHYDSLTQLPNRHSFEKEIPLIVGDAVANGQLAALMFIDLDDFKRINDTAGHEAGDLLLQVVAKRLLGRVAHLGSALSAGGRRICGDPAPDRVHRASGGSGRAADRGGAKTHRGAGDGNGGRRQRRHRVLPRPRRRALGAVAPRRHRHVRRQAGGQERLSPCSTRR